MSAAKAAIAIVSTTNSASASFLRFSLPSAVAAVYKGPNELATTIGPPPKLGGVPSAARGGGSAAEVLQDAVFGTTPPARQGSQAPLLTQEGSCAPANLSTAS